MNRSLGPDDGERDMLRVAEWPTIVVGASLDRTLVFNLVAVLVIALGVLAWVQGLLFVAGVCFLLFSFTLYLRETRT